MSAPAAQIEESLQSPAHAESGDGSENRTQGFASRTGGSAPASERIPGERQSNCPDPDSQFHDPGCVAVQTLVAATATVHPTPTDRATNKSKPQRLKPVILLQHCGPTEVGPFPFSTRTTAGRHSHDRLPHGRPGMDTIVFSTARRQIRGSLSAPRVATTTDLGRARLQPCRLRPVA
jgi:hypothetical protein